VADTLSFPLTRDGIAAQLHGKLEAVDDPLLPRYTHPPERAIVQAAVLVPLIHRCSGVQVLLTQRTAHLHDHAGQISFPGGRVEEADSDRAATALREAEEETGLPRERVEVLGFLPDYDIMTGFRVTPVVAWVEPPFELSPDPFEVAQVFEVPLEFFLDPANHQRHSRVVNGVERHYYAMPYRDWNIWGATAGMLYSLYQALTG
jgi:8-oxo-dGTP pyrophosphatase MutT (NUDIX family)